MIPPRAIRILFFIVLKTGLGVPFMMITLDRNDAIKDSLFSRFSKTFESVFLLVFS